NTTEQTQSALDDEDYRASQLSSHSQLLSALNPHCSAALSEIIVSIDEDESEELPSRSKRTREKKKQISQVCTEAKTTSELKAPLKSHTNRRPCKCHVCSKCFKTPGPLKVHWRIHTGEKSHRCPFCCQGFNTASLKYHQTIHTGEKSFKCQKGGRSVRCKCYINNLHSEKPNQSSVCSTDFINSLPNYKVHQSTHTGEKSFKCPVCIKSFGSASLLKIHQIYHTGEKSHKCKECDKRFYIAPPFFPPQNEPQFIGALLSVIM
uniref:C2H2-type domain-containing protein n=1 Tax=Oncorhynchus tshawytscha TaxID=74940 RepID=A0AAZ3RME1_ONCTS